jgi:hypothetical protein
MEDKVRDEKLKKLFHYLVYDISNEDIRRLLTLYMETKDSINEQYVREAMRIRSEKKRTIWTKEGNERKKNGGEVLLLSQMKFLLSSI